MRKAVMLKQTLLVLFVVLATVGCGESESPQPKKDLTDKDKEQIRQLNEQRASEWSSTKRK
jgi:hypothetical protein